MRFLSAAPHYDSLHDAEIEYSFRTSFFAEARLFDPAEWTTGQRGQGGELT